MLSDNLTEIINTTISLLRVERVSHFTDRGGNLLFKALPLIINIFNRHIEVGEEFLLEFEPPVVDPQIVLHEVELACRV